MHRVPQTWRLRQRLLAFSRAASLGLLIGTLAPATAWSQAFSWTGNSNKNWKAAANWTPTGGPPNAVDAAATFNIGTTGITTTVNTPVTIGSITINQPDAGAASLTINNSGANILTFQTSTGDATFTNQLAAGATTDGTSTVTVSAPVQLNSPLDVTSAFDLASNTAVTFSGGITGSVPINVLGGGNVQISADSPGYTGLITVSNGALRISGNYLTAAGSITVNNGGQFQFGSSTDADWFLAPGSVVYLNGLGKASGANNLGALRFQNNTVATNFDTPVVLQTDSAIGVNGNLTGTPPTVGTLTVTQPISGPGALIKNGTGVLVLANDNTYGVATPTQINGGTLVLANARNDGGFAVPGDVTVGNTSNTNPAILQIGAAGQQLPATANITLVGSTSTPGINGTLNLNSFDQTIGSLNSTDGGGLVQNNGATGNATLTINAAAGSSAFTGVIQDGTDPGTGTLALALSGTQSLTLTGANTYTGATTVNGGTLLANNTTGSATGTGTVTVNAGATLGGVGIITGPVNFVGGSLAPSSGAATPTTLTLGDTSFSAASTLHFQLAVPGTAGGGVNDLVNVNGNLTLAGSLNVVGLTGFGSGAYELFSYTGSLIDNGLSLGTLPTGFTYHIDELSTRGQVLLDVSSASVLLGDVNHDGIVNGQDIAIVASHWLNSGTGLSGDANGDHIVNGQDIAIIASHWLNTSGGGGLSISAGAGPSTAVPEPGGMLLMAVGVVVGIGTMRRWQRGA